MLLLKKSFVDPNSTHFGNGTDQHPMLNATLALGGAGFAAKSYYNIHSYKRQVNNYDLVKNTYNNVKTDLAEWKKTKKIGTHLNNYMTQHGLNVDEVGKHLNDYGSIVRKVNRAKWMGRLGLLGSAYGTYNLLNDISYHKGI